MPTDNAAFVGSIPENYDRYLGPVLFDPYAADLVSRLNVPENASVLELACGTGIVTRSLRDRLGLEAKLVATDLRERSESSLPEIEAAIAAAVTTQFGAAPVRSKMQALVCSAAR